MGKYGKFMENTWKNIGNMWENHINFYMMIKYGDVTGAGRIMERSVVDFPARHV